MISESADRQRSKIRGLHLVIRIIILFVPYALYVWTNVQNTEPLLQPPAALCNSYFTNGTVIHCSFVVPIHSLNKTNLLFACTRAGNFSSCLSHLFVCTVCSQANLIHSVTQCMKRILRWNSNILIQIDARYMSRTHFLRIFSLHV